MSLVGQWTLMGRRFLLHALCAARTVIQARLQSTLIRAWIGKSAEMILSCVVKTVVHSMCPCRFRIRILTANAHTVDAVPTAGGINLVRDRLFCAPWAPCRRLSGRCFSVNVSVAPVPVKAMSMTWCGASARCTWEAMRCRAVKQCICRANSPGVR